MKVHIYRVIYEYAVFGSTQAANSFVLAESVSEAAAILCEEGNSVKSCKDVGHICDFKTARFHVAPKIAETKV